MVETKKYHFIDSIRGFAVIGVTLVHAGVFFESGIFSNAFRNILAHGAQGVQLFFIASAMTIWLSLNSKFKNENKPIISFYLRRFFRIAPLYYIGILYYLWQNGRTPNEFTTGAEITNYTIFLNFTFLHGFNPKTINALVPGGWSIAVEMSFYLIVPILFSKIKNLSGAIWFLNSTLILRLILLVLYKMFYQNDFTQLDELFLFFYLPSQLPVFSLGIILYFIFKKSHDVDKISTPLIIFIFMFIIDLSTGKKLFFLEHIIFGLLFVGIILYIIKISEKYIVNSITCFIGKLSYSIYIVHFAVFYFVNHFFKNSFSEFYNSNIYYLIFLYKYSIALITTIIISYITNKFIEIPGQNFGKYIISKFAK